MREKENEMRSFLEVPRPVEIDFSDRHNQPPPRLKSSTPAPAVELVHLDYNGAAAAAPTSVSAKYDGPGPGSDSPIGDDMDKLIAERIASRERDLAEITEQIKRSAAPTASEQTPRPSPYSTNDIMIMRKPAPALEHKVRFDETPDIIQDSEQQELPLQPPVPDVYSRLKRKNPV